MDREKNNELPNTKVNRFWYGVKAEDGEIFPYPLTEEEHEYYLKLWEEEKKNSKK